MSLQITPLREKTTNIVGLRLRHDISFPALCDLIIKAITIENAALIVLPEHAIFNQEQCHKLVSFSRRYQVMIITGGHSKGNRVVCYVISNGKIIGSVKKRATLQQSLVSISEEKIQVFDVDGIRFCILICRDIERFQVQQQLKDLLVDNKVDIIFNPSLIAFDNPLLIQWMGDSVITTARLTAAENLLELMEYLDTHLFKIDWARNDENGFIDISLIITKEEQVMFPDKHTNFMFFPLKTAVMKA